MPSIANSRSNPKPRSRPLGAVKKGDAKPALRISHIVYGRERSANRVTYLVDPKGQGTLRAAAESVVLRRWRQRKFADHAFSGSRLSPTLWRAVAAALGSDAKRLCELTTTDIQALADKERTNLAAQGFLKLTSAQTLHALFAACGPQRLQAILDRHLSPEHAGLSGIPDLFLYAIDLRTGKPAIARFVEVKKPEEPASRVQLAEIDFLNGLGLHARILRLEERPAAALATKKRS